MSKFESFSNATNTPEAESAKLEMTVENNQKIEGQSPEKAEESIAKESENERITKLNEVRKELGLPPEEKPQGEKQENKEKILSKEEKLENLRAEKDLLENVIETDEKLLAEQDMRIGKLREQLVPPGQYTMELAENIYQKPKEDTFSNPLDYVKYTKEVEQKNIARLEDLKQAVIRAGFDTKKVNIDYFDNVIRDAKAYDGKAPDVIQGKVNELISLIKGSGKADEFFTKEWPNFGGIYKKEKTHNEEVTQQRTEWENTDRVKNLYAKIETEQEKYQINAHLISENRVKRSNITHEMYTLENSG